MYSPWHPIIDFFGYFICEHSAKFQSKCFIVKMFHREIKMFDLIREKVLNSKSSFNGVDILFQIPQNPRYYRVSSRLRSAPPFSMDFRCLKGLQTLKPLSVYGLPLGCQGCQACYQPQSSGLSNIGIWALEASSPSNNLKASLPNENNTEKNR